MEPKDHVHNAKKLEVSPRGLKDELANTYEEMKMSSLLNKAALKKFILAKLEANRPELGLTRVSKEALDTIEARLKNMIENDISTHPSIGKTYKP